MDMDMGGMDMGNSSSNACKISMLWNWNVMDACFIAESWHIRSKGMFAGSCIGVVLLVIALEALKWSGRRYDAYLIRLAQKAAQGKSTSLSATPTLEHDKAGSGEVAVPRKPIRPRLKVLQQVIRSFIHMLQFGVAYFVMLLAMYYNGYFIICILLGAFIGNFIFSWDVLEKGNEGPDEVTACCG